MGLRMFSWLTLLPMVLMGVGTWLAPAALRRLGLRPAIVWALLAIGLGCALRWPAPTPGCWWPRPACAGRRGPGPGHSAGADQAPVPHRMAVMMGLYSAALMGAAHSAPSSRPGPCNGAWAGRPPWPCGPCPCWSRCPWPGGCWGACPACRRRRSRLPMPRPSRPPVRRPVTPAGWCAGRAPGCCC
jgi:CP family cyanate transporter-like MFS transporter